MNIAFLRALPIGHAIELSVAIPPDIIGWHVRRRLDAAFPADPLDLTDSDLIYAEERLPANRLFWMPLLDTRDIEHGPLYYYQASGFDGTVWQKSPIRSIAALARAQDRTTDPLLLLRDRLQVGLEDEVLAGRLRPHAGRIPVLTAPPQADATSWPLVTLHLESDMAAERFIGEQLDQDHRALSGSWWESEGWLSRIDISVMGWSQNPDERIALRLALKRLIVGNLPVFAAHGLLTPDWSQRDSEDFQTYNAPVYQTVGTFSCLAATALTWPEPAIATVDVIHHDRTD